MLFFLPHDALHKLMHGICVVVDGKQKEKQSLSAADLMARQQQKKVKEIFMF